MPFVSTDVVQKLRELSHLDPGGLKRDWTEKLVSRGVNRNDAEAAAQKCMDHIRNTSIVYGGVGALAGVYVGALAGFAAGLTIGAFKARVFDAECDPVRDYDVMRAVNEVLGK
jgi:hypothetical protein